MTKGKTMTVNIHEAKTQLSRLVEEAAGGREIVIAKAGRDTSFDPPGFELVQPLGMGEIELTALREKTTRLLKPAAVNEEGDEVVNR